MRSVDPRIDRYLERAARRLSAGGRFPAAVGEGGVTVVRGGPAADPDSVAGSLAYAFLLAEEEGERGRFVLPALPIPREDLHLRPEVLLLLATAGIDPDRLPDSRDVSLPALDADGVCLVLVDSDGRELPAALRRRVVEVVDHHEPAAELPQTTRRRLAPVGSACTLVTEQILMRRPPLLDGRLSCLLLGPILLDTVDLDPSAGRVTERDAATAERLRKAARMGCAELYGRLLEARRRLEGLSGGDLLRRDYKGLEAGGLRIGMASVPLPMHEWRARSRDPRGCLRRFAVERELDVLIVMLSFRGAAGEFRRQLVLQARGAARYHALAAFLQERGLALRGLPEGAGEAADGPPEGPAAESGSADQPGRPEWVLGAFEQGETGFSRKRLEPELRRFAQAQAEA